MATAMLCFLTAPAPAQRSGEAMISDLFAPVVLTSTGLNNSYYTSELTLTNRGSETATLHYTYTAAAGGGTGTTLDTLPAGRQKTVPDAITYLRALGVPIPGVGNRIGTLRVEVSGSSGVSVVTRITTQIANGRAGLAYPGIAAADGFEEAVYLAGLRQNHQDRSNVALQNMGTATEGNVTLRATAYSGDSGGASRVLPEVTLAPGGFRQFNGILATAGITQGYVKVERVGGRAPFYAYGVINDQATSDGSFVFPVTESYLAGARGQTLPVIVEAGNFSSELIVTNFSTSNKAITFDFVADAVGRRDRTASFSLRLAAGEQRIIPEIVEELRRMGLEGIGPPGQTFAGAVFATERSDDLSGVVIGARTGSPGGGGQYSVFYNAVPYGAAFDQEAWIDALQQNRENRSNLALVNTGEVDAGDSVFDIEIYDGETGALVNTVAGIRIRARGWHQFNGILSSYAPGVDQGYVRINKTSGNNPFLAYGIINDGAAPGERTGDGAYLPAMTRIHDSGNNEGTGPGTNEGADREVLKALYKATNGPNWGRSHNWLTEAPLGEWDGVVVGSDGRVQELDLSENNLTGPIPPELGRLGSLQHLGLWSNNLTGPIPPELGNLQMLESLHLFENQLTGSVPASLLRLEALQTLQLYNNALSGSLPGGMGSLQQLEEFWVGNNPKMSGSLPLDMAEMASLESFKAGGTALCAPDDEAYLEWLAGIPFHRVARCVGAAAYLTQSVQSRTNPVPLIAGDPALLRAFVASPDADGEPIPPARVGLYLDGSLVREIEIESGIGTIPSRIEESEASLERSINADVPGDLVRPGLEFVVDVDPDGALDPALGVTGRIPTTGRMAVDVVELQNLQLTVVPFLHETEPDSSILEITQGMADDPGVHPMLEHVRVLLPVGGIDLELHAPVLTSDNVGFQILQQTEMLRQMEGRPGYWLGMQGPPRPGLLGVASDVPSWSSFSQPHATTIAHEIGHNMGLWHAPCGGAGGPDPLFPHPVGLSDSWGYDMENRRLVSPYSPDLMSYCGGQWIGDYHYANALRHRMSTEAESGVASRVSSLVVWGGLDADGKLYLEPAFLTDAMPTVPPQGVGFTLRGTTEGGGKAFSLRFDMPAIQDSQEGRRGFVFSVPVTWTGALESIVLVGNNDTAVLNRDTNRPFSILRDPATGQVRAFLRTRQPMASTAKAVDAMGAVDYEVLFSAGIPDFE